MSDILEVVLHDEERIANEIVPAATEDSIAHYGRLGMKWYQHIYGEYQGAAKYAEKGAKKVDRLQDRGRISEAKRLRKKVDKFLTIAEKQQTMSNETKQKIVDSINEHSSDKDVQAAAQKIKDFEATSKASDEIIDRLRQDRINDLTRGIGDWKKASDSDIAAAITRLNLEKQYKEIRDDVSGAKVWKDAGKEALNSVAKSSGKILEEIVKTAGNIAEKKNEGKIAADKDARTWAREDETHARDRKEKLADQARDDKNAELKAQRDVAKEEAKNRADYLSAQTKAKEAAWKEEQERAGRSQASENDRAVREVLEGKRAEASLTVDQTKGLKDYVDRMYDGKSVRKVLDSNERARKKEKAKADAEAEAKAQADYAARNEKAAKEASEAHSKEREQRAKVEEAEMKRKQEAHDTAERERRIKVAAEQAVKEREASEKAKGRLEKESALDFYKGLQDSQRSSGGSSNSGSNESHNDRFLRNSTEIGKIGVKNHELAEAIDTGSSLLDKWIRHSSVPVFRRMSRDEYYAIYKGLRWKSS